MNKIQKVRFKKILLKLREDIVEKVKHIKSEHLGQTQREASGDLSGYGLHMADAASDSFERELSLGLAENEQVLLYKIDDSLKRIKDRNFGKCENCSKDIGMKRLGAVPYALLCVSCQEQEDKKPRT
ncbi:MAG: TraR/DksA family transcriptional regulator [Candidatus Omnitrophota bacterium]